ncbi:hypothetical protein M6B38_128095 [Iris pallida]|uniref:Uncharacterized protein n=1 Tax=Iris pallida TaxID=29817 RepID=A0AAX6G571_IRIPA|nr:hypothetical protein M6B38_128095 [Iris pallida]
MATPAKFVGWRHHYEGGGASFFPRRWRWQAATRWRQRWFLRPDGDSGGSSDPMATAVVFPTQRRRRWFPTRWRRRHHLVSGGLASGSDVDAREVFFRR